MTPPLGRGRLSLVDPNRPAVQDLQTCDLVVLGSGAAGLAAAVTAACRGLSVSLIERDGMVGGTSAISGGALWIPQTRQAVQGGYADSRENARVYLQNVLGQAYDAELVDAFLDNGPRALAYLEDHTELKYAVRALSPDYYPEIEGATDNGRALEVAGYDGRRLGPWFDRLRPPPRGMMLFGGMMLSRTDVAHFLRMRSSLPSLAHCAGLTARYFADRLGGHRRGTRLMIGNAMVATLLRAALDRNVRIQLAAETEALLTSGEGRVVGVRVRRADGSLAEIAARGGVVLATGGLGRAPEAAQERPDTGADHLSMSAPWADGRAIALAAGLGAQVGGGLLSSFYWAPMSRISRGERAQEVFPHIVTDRAKPGVIAVNDKAARFVNEANSYHRFVEAMRAERRAGAERFFLIADRKALEAYGMGLARPKPGDNSALIRDGYLIEAKSIPGLAERLGIDAGALTATVGRFNAHAASGQDPDFRKGESAYNRAMGDMTAAHPNLASLTCAPFYAVQIHTGDLGSAKGLRTDGRARVRRPDGSLIAGLYAAGNDMNSMMAGGYPGPGITLGPAITFGWLAAMTAADELA